MNALHFEWDETKARTNAKKHGVGFEEAKSVFLDDHAKMIPDRITHSMKIAFFCWAIAQA